MTQNDPAFCGLGTLCMVLNALEIDPQRKWKGPWRWYEQEVSCSSLTWLRYVFAHSCHPVQMLDCCRPLEHVAKEGISLAEFACLARCNGLSATVHSPRVGIDEDADQSIGIARFRADLSRMGRGETTMAMAYSRKVRCR